MSLPLSLSLYLFSFTFNILFSIHSWINQLRQGFPIQMDSSAQHPSNEIINSTLVITVIASYRFLGPVFGNLSEQPLPEDVQVVGDAQGSPSRIVPHCKTIPQTPAEEIKGLKIEIDIFQKVDIFK